MADTLSDLPDTTGADVLLHPRSIPPLPLDIPDTTGADAWLAPPPQPASSGTPDDVLSTPPAAPPQGAPPPSTALPPGQTADGPSPAPAPGTPAPLSNRAADLTKRRPQVAGVIDGLAAAHGIDPAMLKVFAHIESDGDPNSITGSYKGLFQLSDAEFARHGSGGSIFDPKANTTAAINILREKSHTFQKTYGRLPTPTELYLMHQQGEGGLAAHLKNLDQPAWMSMASTSEGRQKGEGWAKKAVWGNVPDDLKPQFGSVDKITSAQFIALWAMKVQGIPYQQALSMAQNGRAGEGSIYGAPVSSSGPVRPVFETAPSFAPAGTPDAEVERNKIAAWKPSPTFYQTVEAAADETTFAYIFRSNPIFNPDPAYQPTAVELEQRQAGLPEKFHDRLIGVSQAHSDHLTQQAHRQWKNEQTLEEAGWTGTGISLLSSLLDPVDLAAAIATGGLGAATGGVMKLGRLGQRLAAGASAAAGNMALTGVKQELGRVTEGSEYAYAAALGMAFGFAFGPFSRNSATQDLARAGAKAANEAVHGIESKRMAEVAGDLGAARTSLDTTQFTADPLARMGQDEAPHTALAALPRVDMAGRAGQSANPVVRVLGAVFGFDPVGRVGPNGERVAQSASVGEMFSQIRSGWHNRVYAVSLPQFDEWARANGHAFFWERVPGLGKAWDDFADAVFDYRLDRRADRDLHHAPQVRKVDAALTAAFEDHRQGNIRPRAQDDPANPGRALGGDDSRFANVPRNPHYMPRQWLLSKIQAVDGSGRTFQDWLEGAVLSAHPELGDKAATIARGFYKNIVGRAYGLDGFEMRVRDGATAQVMRDAMTDLGIDAGDIEEILSRLSKGSKPDFAHFRLDLDDSFKLDGLRLADFVETNAFKLFDHYNHQASGWRALGKARIVDGEGILLLDGIRSTKEFEALLQVAKARGYEAGQTARQIESDARILQEMFDRVRGVPHALAGTTLDQVMEVVRNTATVLFGGSFGLSALGDAGKLASLGGVRAFLQHVPALRQMVDQGGERVFRKLLSQDLNAIFAFADEFRPFSTGWERDLALASPAEGALGRVVGASRVGADAIVRMSGMPAINRRIRESAAGIMVQRFYNDAVRAFHAGGIDISRLRPTELERLKWFGLDQDMLVRVLSQIQTHSETAPGFIGDTVQRFNPHKWTDPEALAAFATAVRRGSNRAAMEHDVVGSGTVWDRSPVFRSLIQLRRFALNAWHQNILHGAHYRDGEAFMDVAATSFTAAMLYVARTHMKAASSQDPDAYLREHLSPRQITAATFELGAYSSLLPMLVDNVGMNLIGSDPLFGYRNSSLPTAGLFANPSFRALDAALQAPGALIRPFASGRPRSQQEWRQVAAVVPFQNNFAVQMALGAMIRDAPKRAPRNGGYSLSDALLGADN